MLFILLYSLHIECCRPLRNQRYRVFHSFPFTSSLITFPVQSRGGTTRLKIAFKIRRLPKTTVRNKLISLLQAAVTADLAVGLQTRLHARDLNSKCHYVSNITLIHIPFKKKNSVPSGWVPREISISNHSQTNWPWFLKNILLETKEKHLDISTETFVTFPSKLFAALQLTWVLTGTKIKWWSN